MKRKCYVAAVGAFTDPDMMTELSPKLAESLKPDVIIAALGGTAVKPAIPGIDGKNVFSAQEIYENGVIADVVYECDTVACATGLEPLREQAFALSNSAPEFYQIGDCVEPGSVINVKSEVMWEAL